MSGALTILQEDLRDPARLGYPPTLPIEIALRERSPTAICKEYDLGKEDWDRIRKDPRFIKALEQAVADIKRDGMGFKVKARLQAEALLQTSWNLIHSPNEKVPPNVKADLIKFTVRAAGLDGSRDQISGGSVNNGTALQINIDLSGARS